MEETITHEPYDNCITELNKITLKKNRSCGDNSESGQTVTETSTVAEKEAVPVSPQRAQIADLSATKSQIIKSKGIPVLSKKRVSDKSWIQKGRGLYSSDQSVNRPASRPSQLNGSGEGNKNKNLSPVSVAQIVYSPMRLMRKIDPTLSLRRYSLFGPNVAPVWEYYTDVPGLIQIPSDTPVWKVSMFQKRNCALVHTVMRREEQERCRREMERIELERRTCVPEWMKEISERRRRRKLQQFDDPQRAVPADEECHDDETEELQEKTLPPWQQELLLRRRGQISTNRVPIK